MSKIGPVEGCYKRGDHSVMKSIFDRENLAACFSELVLSIGNEQGCETKAYGGGSGSAYLRSVAIIHLIKDHACEGMIKS
jgi:hypothetical protein